MAETALGGIRVLEVGLLVQAPQAGQMLSDLGADVIKVEMPAYGDQSRWIPISAAHDLRTPYLVGCNRGKRSVTLDLHLPKGREVFLQMVQRAEVVISNLVPGTLDGWGLGYDDLAAANPGIVYAAGSAYGFEGPDATIKGADIGGQAAGGILTMIGDQDGPVRPVGVTFADHIASQNMVAGVLAALLARHRTGRGQKVEVSLYGGQLFAQASELVAHSLTGSGPGPGGQGHQLIPAIYGIFPTADGHIALVGVPDKASFFALIGRPELIDDDRFMGVFLEDAPKRELFGILDDVLVTRTTAEWDELFRANDVRFAPVRTYADVMADEGAHANGYLQVVDHPEWGEVVMPGTPVALSDTPAVPGKLAPELGQHTEEVLLETGYDWEDIGPMRDAGVI
ncbi:MAG: CoA transferase [Acidimicrobiia bacterium]|nr:CoA transferase [Acidimicrobiia bacterium]